MLVKLTTCDKIEISLKQKIEIFLAFIAQMDIGKEEVGSLYMFKTTITESYLVTSINSKTIVVNLDDLFDCFPSGTPGVVIQAKNELLSFLKQNPTVFSAFLNTYDLTTYSTKGIFLKLCLSELISYTEIDESIQTAIEKLISYIDTSSTGFPFITYYDNVGN